MTTHEAISRDPGTARPHKTESTPANSFGAWRSFLDLVPQEFARRHLILGQVPAARSTHEVLPGSAMSEWLAVTDRTSAVAIFNVCTRLGRQIPTHTVDAVDLAALIDQAYLQHHAERVRDDEPRRDDSVDILSLPQIDNSEAELSALISARDADLLATAGKADVTRLVDLIIFDAIRRDASDIHVQPVDEHVLVRYRLDGVLHTVRALPATLAAAVISRIKVMARLDVAEHRAAQDGRAAVTLGGSMGDRRRAAEQRIDMRISTLPSTYGERVVIRLLHNARSSYRLSFASLGMPSGVEAAFKAQASRANGIILATGPTGSGKTTTLYTTLKWIAGVRATNGSGHDTLQRGGASDVNIMTIEDPVEYDLATSSLTISQTQVDPRKSVTFATGLRHILRQDPDVIMVGEIRDADTARIAVQASLTGHLVLSTLHTNDAPSAIARLIDLGAEPFLVASSLSAVLAQRLVRRSHAECNGNGCDRCLKTGFQGRVAVFELLTLTQAMRDRVCERVPASLIRALAVDAGMTTLQCAAAQLVSDGVTTASEVARVINASE